MWELTLRGFVVFTQFDDLVDVLTSKSLLDNDDVALGMLVNWTYVAIMFLLLLRMGIPNQ